MKVDAEAAGFDPRRLDRIEEHLLRRYVAPGKVAGCSTLVARGGQVAHLSCLGSADLAVGRPVQEDTIWRLYSMTKPITAVALLTLYERGLLALTDPVSSFLPSWRELKVRDGDALVDPEREPTVRDLLTHTSGIGYAPGNGDLGFGAPLPWATLEELADGIVEAPLRFHPGSRWLYSFGTDVCARLVEVLSGMRFDDYLRSAVLDPLGMVDTDFCVPQDKADRLAALYLRGQDKQLVPLSGGRSYTERPSLLNGGGGLLGTLPDYLRFTQMLLNGGVLDDVRVLGRKTVELMRTNHLPGDAALRDLAAPGLASSVGFEGMGFGLTVAVSNGPGPTGAVGSAGEFMWFGLASTTFWVDPVEDLLCIFMTQLMPAGSFDVRGELKSIVYGAIAD
jgi:CubicO group peptidase (beta-lactamase class C family)